MAEELFTQDTVPRLTWANVWEAVPEALDVAPVAPAGQPIIAPNIIGGIMQGASYRSGDSGARFEIFPEEDKNIGCVVYNAAGTVVFKTIIGGTDTGDVIMGDYAGGAGAKWDQSASSFDVLGSITATSGAIGGWTIVAGYIYNLQSGTPTSSPSDGLVLASGNEAIIVYENTEKRVELGYLSAGVYGIKVYADDGTTVLFEASDTQTTIVNTDIVTSEIRFNTIFQRFVYIGSKDDGATEYTEDSSSIQRYPMTTKLTVDDNNTEYSIAALALPSSLGHLSTVTFNEDFEIVFFVRPTGSGGSPDTYYHQIAMSAISHATDPTPSEATNHYIRIFIDDLTTVYAQNCEGTTQTSTDITSEVGTIDAWHTFRIVFTAGTDIKFYHNDVLVATHTTNLPTGATSPSFYFQVSTGELGGGGNSGAMYFSNNYSIFLTQP